MANNTGTSYLLT